MINIISIITESAWKKVLDYSKICRDVMDAIEQHNLILPSNIDIFDLRDDQKNYLKSIVSSNKKSFIILEANNLEDFYSKILYCEALKSYDLIVEIDEQKEFVYDDKIKVYSVMQVLNKSKIGEGLYWFTNGCSIRTKSTDSTLNYIQWFKLLFTNESKLVITDRYFFEENAKNAIDNYFMELFKMVGLIEINYGKSICSCKLSFENSAKKNGIKFKCNGTCGHNNHGRCIELKNYIIEINDGIDVFANSVPKVNTLIQLIKK